MPFTQTQTSGQVVLNSICENRGNQGLPFNSHCSVCNQPLADWTHYVRQIVRSPRTLPQISYMHTDCHEEQPIPLSCKDSNGRDCDYALERLGLPDGRTLLIVTELDSNRGMNITNNVERAMVAAVNTCKLYDPSRVIFVEHYPDKPGTRTKTYDQVTFGSVSFRSTSGSNLLLMSNPAWRRMTSKDWAVMGITSR